MTPTKNRATELSSQTMDKLTKAAESFASANKSLRDVIKLSEGEIGRLESFETGFNVMMDRFSQFTDSAMKHDKLANDLQIFLHQQLVDINQNIDSLRSEIVQLKQANENQKGENDKLERALEMSVEKFQRLQFDSDYNIGNIREPLHGLITTHGTMS